MKTLVVLEGKLNNDPVLNESATDKALCRFEIGNNRYYFSGSDCTAGIGTFTIEAHGALALNCCKHLRKGDSVIISGYIDVEAKKNNTKVIAANVKYIGKRKTIA